MNIPLSINPADSLVKNKLIFSFFLLSVLPLTIIISSVGSQFPKIFLVILLSVFSLLIFDTKLIFFVFISSIFANYYNSRLSISVLFSILILISFLINFYKITKDDFSIPINKYFLVCGISFLPSLINVNFTTSQIILYYNIAAFLMVFYISAIVSQNFDLKSLFIKNFLTISFINGLIVIASGILTNKRIFGFAGVMFVDYVCIALIISLIYFILEKGYKKFFFGFLAVIFLVASIYTQTRNPYFATFMTFLSLILYLIKNSALFGLQKNKLIRYLALIIIFFAFLVVIFQNINPNVIERTTDVKQFETTFTEEGEATNSLITRVLIWDTAIAGIKEHPIIGMGLYSFPFSAVNYYTIPKFLFETYVKGLTPHQAFIAILAETGLIGLIGFFILITGILRFNFKAVLKNNCPKERKRILVINFVQVYILFSMLMTDAWLWGQGLILWALILGLNLGEYKLISKQSQS